MAQREADEAIQADFTYTITGLIRPTHLTKAAAEGSAEQIADIVKEGHANALDVSTKIAWMVGVLETARKMIQDDAVREIEKHNDKATINGAEVVKAETGTRYDYSGCGDPEWKALESLATSTAEARKAREKFLRSMTKPENIVTDDGEAVTVNPPQRTSQTNIKISFQ